MQVADTKSIQNRLTQMFSQMEPKKHLVPVWRSYLVLFVLDEVRLAADFAKILQKVGLGTMETEKSNYFSGPLWAHCNCAADPLKTRIMSIKLLSLYITALP